MEKNIFESIDKEIVLNRNFSIISKVNKDGIIEYVNDYFLHVTGYTTVDVIGKSNAIIKHEGMPLIIFSEIEKRLKEKGKAYGIVKNLAKNGNYFWTIDYFEAKFDTKGNVDSYFVKRKFVSISAKKQIEKLYKKLRAIELNNNDEVTRKYFYGFLESINKTYYEYILSILSLSENEIYNYYNTEEKFVAAENFDDVELGIIERALLQN